MAAHAANLCCACKHFDYAELNMVLMTVGPSLSSNLSMVMSVLQHCVRPHMTAPAECNAMQQKGDSRYQCHALCIVSSP